ncbi:diguanylate cyclase [Bacillus alkalicellulosilyticus]|uniref:GGDEF domain-containing response regulator n=1 Tax=Alkalihalobacterium alkalicellulosilyticum TaxID=1912214 RepID=UPI000998316D|nr:diguanylate cyclase [Bacillus alkalicellulosilyticus]
MEKYQKMLLERMKETITRWNKAGTVTNKEIYRFFHSLKGTAASIDLSEIASLAEDVLEEIDESRTEDWEKSEWVVLIEPLQPFLTDDVPITNEVIEPISPTIKEERNNLILLVDDDFEMVTYLKEQLEQKGYLVMAAMTAAKALQIFYNQKPDCVIIDIYLPDKSGFHVLETILAKSHTFFIPTIIISAEKTKEKVIHSFKAGATDFLEKPIDIEELVVRIENRLRHKELISEAVLLDELTGAFNRKFFNIEIERQYYEFKRSNESFSLVLIDLDHFKNVNDTYGHLVGDNVLRDFANLTKKVKRQSDLLIRYGGEEFVLVLPRTNKKQAEIFVDRLRTSFADVIFKADGVEFQTTFSAGIVEINNDNYTIDEYIHYADLALYKAKELGRNTVVIFNEDEVQKEKEKVLHIGIIDDDNLVRHIVSDQLANVSIGDYALDIQSFREGESFFESDWHNQSGKFLLVLDGVMPRMDGLEVLQKIKKHRNERNIIVLMLTGRKGENDIAKALEMGADDYLTKPFSIVELVARVKRLLLRMTKE